MTKRLFNFSAGPAMLPAEVLVASARALVDYNGMGVGIAELSHRGKEFDAVLDECFATCKRLLAVPDTHDVLFMQGGATQLFNVVPMNILHGTAEYVTSGLWGQKAAKAAKAAYGDKIKVIGSSEATNFDRPATGWTASPDTSYLHVCSNETVHGHRLVHWPEHKNLVVDASSEMMSRPHPIDRTALVYAGAQKNLGPAGVVLVIVRKDLYERIAPNTPEIFNFKVFVDNKSCLNTPPTFGIYVLMETFRWMEKQGGLAALEARNAEKAAAIYQAIDESGGFYQGTVADVSSRSHMNVTFRPPNEELTDALVKECAKEDMVGLKGYRSVGGVRASIYNAMPLQGCQALAAKMRQFAATRG